MRLGTDEIPPGRAAAIRILQPAIVPLHPGDEVRLETALGLDKIRREPFVEKRG